MRRIITRLLVLNVSLMLFGLAVPQSTSAQDCVIPTKFFRFVVSPVITGDGGFLLSGYFPEGAANNYPWDNGGLFSPVDSIGQGMYFPPSNGDVPPAGSGLVPLYRWTVIQDGWRTHYYYSVYYTEQPPDRYFNGIAAYVFPPSQDHYNGAPLRPLYIWYSSDFGFWYGWGANSEFNFYEAPPEVSAYKDPYHYQGIIAYLPPAVWDYWHPPNPGGPQIPNFWQICFQPPGGGGGGGGGGNNGDCNPPQSTLNACQHNGGSWNYDGCYCEY